MKSIYKKMVPYPQLKEEDGEESQVVQHPQP
jgi:hypothetical protein